MSKVFESGRALLIGIGSGYPGNLALPDVVSADAKAMESVLTDPSLCGYVSENVQTLLDERATRSNIVNGLEQLVRSAKPTDTVIVFFSGHGAQRGGPGGDTYLCPVDFDSSDPQRTGLESSEFSDLIKRIPGERVVVAIDACHAESTLFLKDEQAEKSLLFRPRSAEFEKLAEGKGRVFVTSCREDETSRTLIAKGHSLFTYYLLEGLRGAAFDRNDGLIRVLDLFHYVSEEVPRQVSNGHTQHPVMKAHAESNFPLALRKGGLLKSVTVTTESVSQRKAFDTRRVETTLCQLYPSGPEHDELWSRAGGDRSALKNSGNGRASWHAALRMLSQGGGGTTIEALIEVAVQDYPGNVELSSL